MAAAIPDPKQVATTYLKEKRILQLFEVRLCPCPARPPLANVAPCAFNTARWHSVMLTTPPTNILCHVCPV
jgi:hypothetical protein